MVRLESSNDEYYGGDGYCGAMQRTALAVGPCSRLVDEICQTDSSLN